MGYLDSDTTSVDAILTKHGRKKLADGHDLGIRHFALADDGVDYTLYNIGHISGSNSYGSDITAMPLPEAVPDDTIAMKYMLLTRPRNTVYQPFLDTTQQGGRDIVIKDQGTSYKQTFTFETVNGPAEAVDITVMDTSAFQFHGASGKDIGGAQGYFISQQYVQQPKVFRVKSGALAVTSLPTSADISSNYKMVGVESGATIYGTITANKNIKNALVSKANAGTTA